MTIRNAVQSSPYVVDLYSPPMKANALLKENIDALLRARGQSRKDLAQWCRRTESWISKIFRNPNKEFPMQYLDRAADFFGVQPYQLFQPGISTLTERRTGLERRTATDRRIGHPGRHLAGLRTELNKLPAIASAHGPPSATRPSASPEPVKRILARAEAEIHAFYAREQAPAPRVERPTPVERRGKSSGSHTSSK